VKKIVILGVSGMLGSAVASVLNENHQLWCYVRRDASLRGVSLLLGDKVKLRCVGDVGVTGWHKLEIDLKLLRPDVVINAIGVVKQNSAVEDHEQTLFTNSLLPHLLDRTARQIGYRLIHFSTDCVFSGRRGPYLESSVPDPGDFYGRTKLLGEVESNHAVTIRSSIVGFSIDDSKRGLFDWFLSNRGGVVNGYDRALYSGLTTLEMAKLVSLIIDRFERLSGVWQVSGEEIDKASLLSLLNESMDLGIQIKRDSSFMCDRRLNSDRFREATGWKPPSWKTMIDELVARKKITDGILEAHQ
jgi:dTDP-4-dehydrorhamnose reductase